MEDAQDIVSQNLQQMQSKEKQWYDCQAREMQLEVGKQVLPDDARKFSRLQGLYHIRCKLGRVNYEIEMPDKGHNQVFHVNLLKHWSSFVNIIEEDTNMILYKRNNDAVLNIRELLNSQQRQEQMC